MKKLTLFLSFAIILSLSLLLTSCDITDFIGGGHEVDGPIYGGGEEEFTEAFRFEEINGGYMLVEYYEKNHDGTDVVIPETYNGHKITGINGPVFTNSNITSLVIPASVEFIPGSLLEGCTTIRKLTLPANGCIAVNDDFSIGQTLFNAEAPESLVEVIINGGSRIGDRKFHDCVYIEKITISGDVEEIGYGAFENCISLRSIVIEEGVAVIGGHAFHNCTALDSIHLPESIETIDYGAFYGCSNLKELTLPEKITNIPTYFFEGCTSLKSISFGESVTNIGGCAFMGCSAFETVYFSGSREAWEKIVIDDYCNDYLINAEKYFNGIN